MLFTQILLSFYLLQHYNVSAHPLALPPPLVKRGVIDAVGPSCSHWLRRRSLGIEAPAEIINHPAQVKSAVSATKELTKGTEPLSNELRENVNGELGLDSLAHPESKPSPATLDPLPQPSGTTSISESGQSSTPITEPRTSDSQEVDLKKGEGVGLEAHGNEQNGLLPDPEIIPAGSNLHSATEPQQEGIEYSAHPHGSNGEIHAEGNQDVVPKGHQHEGIAENNHDNALEPKGGRETQTQTAPHENSENSAHDNFEDPGTMHQTGGTGAHETEVKKQDNPEGSETQLHSATKGSQDGKSGDEEAENSADVDSGNGEKKKSWLPSWWPSWLTLRKNQKPVTSDLQGQVIILEPETIKPKGNEISQGNRMNTVKEVSTSHEKAQNDGGLSSQDEKTNSIDNAQATRSEPKSEVIESEINHPKGDQHTQADVNNGEEFISDTHNGMNTGKEVSEPHEKAQNDGGLPSQDGKKGVIGNEKVSGSEPKSEVMESDINHPKGDQHTQADVKNGEGFISDTHGNEESDVGLLSQDHKIIPSGSIPHSSIEPQSEDIGSSVNPDVSNGEVHASENKNDFPQSNQHTEKVENHHDGAHDANDGKEFQTQTSPHEHGENQLENGPKLKEGWFDWLRSKFGRGKNKKPVTPDSREVIDTTKPKDNQILEGDGRSGGGSGSENHGSEGNGRESSFQDHTVHLDEREPAVDGQDPNGNHQKPKGGPDESSRHESSGPETGERDTKDGDEHNQEFDGQDTNGNQQRHKGNSENSSGDNSNLGSSGPETNGHTQQPVTENHEQQSPHSSEERGPTSEQSQSENTPHQQASGPESQIPRGGENDAPKGPQNPEKPGQGPTQQAAAPGKPPRAKLMERIKSFFSLWGQKFREIVKKLAFWRKKNPEVTATTT
ncbi:hypothetical protein PGT21_030050 [Puccinia graminis f. sp. tritici]|uniref:Uncharacterized protein n=1 Tax=Puccinia graminis f. sp. tritici TaxID=56615 RepID=A0A5B0NPT5_PUCGR|nr:hypothetical protein PGT21_030050 [Puccinia graminis f. sp. tritici]